MDLAGINFSVKWNIEFFLMKVASCMIGKWNGIVLMVCLHDDITHIVLHEFEETR